MSLQEGLVQPAHGACDVILLGTLVEACRSPARTVSGGLQHVSGGVCYYDGGGPVALLTGWAGFADSGFGGGWTSCWMQPGYCRMLSGATSWPWLRSTVRRRQLQATLAARSSLYSILYSQLAAPCLPRSKLVVSVEARLATSCFTALRRA